MIILRFKRGTFQKIIYPLPVVVMMLTFMSPLTGSADPYPCDVNGDQKLGLEEALYILQDFSGAFAADSDEVLDCGEPDFTIIESGNLSIAAKRYILCRINEIRSQLALGTIADDGTNGQWPVAANMKRMKWNADLATVAQNYASQCVYGHNDNRGLDYGALTGMPDPSVGENIAAQWTSGSLGSSAAIAALQSAFSGWNGEHDLWHYDTINNNSWNSGIGHFTQHVWADTIEVGCGQAWCPSYTWSCDPSINCTGISNSWNLIYTVCNFYIAGNWWGAYPYESGGEVCTEGLEAGDSCENGLITPADYHSGIDFECDVNGDGRMGLEELVEALQIISGHL